MKKIIDAYIQGIAHDNAEYIKEGGYKSIADYIISDAEAALGYYEFFDDEETEANLGEPTQGQIDELKDYLNKYYDYLPE